MAERLITPEDFATGAPPRMMGTEAEDSVNLRRYSEGATKFDKKKEDEGAIATLLSHKTFNKIGISVRKGSSLNWLSNGQLIYLDCRMLESCTAEQLGPKKALAATLAGVRVVEKLAKASELDVRIFRRSATVDAQGNLAKAGFHMNHITSSEAALRIQNNSSIKTHAATRLYTWEGMVAPEGFVLSQKAYVYNEVLQYEFKGDAGSGFGRIEDKSGDDSSPWGTFMAMATTSILLRILEHPEQKDLNKRLSKLDLPGPNTGKIVSRDKTLKETLTVVGGRHLTAIEIQTELADIAREFSNRFTLPADEQFALDEWQKVCRDLTEAAKTGDLRPLTERIGWVSKKRWLELDRNDVGSLEASNPKAVLFDMSWDSYYPKKGGRLLYPQKTGLTIVTEADIQKLVDNPPQDTRALIRGEHIGNQDLYTSRINWDEMSIKSKKEKEQEFHTLLLHPYQTSMLEL
jgi:hypothetical protein